MGVPAGAGHLPDPWDRSGRRLYYPSSCESFSPGDAAKISYRFQPAHRGDLEVVDPPAGGTELIKRVVGVGLSGDMVRVRGGRTWINGRLLDEPWVAHFGGMEYGPAGGHAGHLFIMGENCLDHLCLLR